MKRRTLLALTGAVAAVSLVPGRAAEAEPGWSPVTFCGIYTTLQGHGPIDWDIEVRGLVQVRCDWHGLLAGGPLEYVYKIEGRKAPFEVKANRPLQDSEVLDSVFTYLVGRERAQGDFVERMEDQWRDDEAPLWLFRTSVLDYHVSQRLTEDSPALSRLMRIDHTDKDFAGLIEVGVIGPVV